MTSMLRSTHKMNSLRRSAFTLVELLVAMGIFVILASLAVTGYQSTYNMDQVGQAASTVRASLEGARSRAIKAKGRRGLRLLLDPQDRRIVTSLAYVSPPETVTGYLRLEFDNRQPADDPPPEDSPSFGRWRVFHDNGSINDENTVDSIPWRTLYEQAMLRPGCQVTFDIGADNVTAKLLHRSRYGGNATSDAWVIDVISGTVSSAPPPVGASPEQDRTGSQRLQGAYSDPDDQSGAVVIGLPTAVASIRIKYTLSLQPAIIEGTTPVALPTGTCIDLDGSRIPAKWRPGYTSQNPGVYSTPVAPDRAYGPLLNSALAPAEVGPIDIFFTSNGSLQNDLQLDAFLIFRIASREDLIAARQELTDPLESLGTDGNPVVVRDPERPAKLVTLSTKTGMMRVSNVSGEGDTNGKFNNELLDHTNAFRDSILGKEAKQ